MNKKTTYIISGLAIALVGVLCFGASYANPAFAKSITSKVSTSTPMITKAVLSRSIDAKGVATGVTTSFSAKTDKMVYAVLTLKNVTKNTKISYVRKLNGKYVDSKVAMPTKNGINSFYFGFEKGIGEYPKGAYSLAIYINGKKSQTLNYVVK